MIGPLGRGSIMGSYGLQLFALMELLSIKVNSKLVKGEKKAVYYIPVVEVFNWVKVCVSVCENVFSAQMFWLHQSCTHKRNFSYGLQLFSSSYRIVLAVTVLYIILGYQIVWNLIILYLLIEN